MFFLPTGVQIHGEGGRLPVDGFLQTITLFQNPKAKLGGVRRPPPSKSRPREYRSCARSLPSAAVLLNSFSTQQVASYQEEEDRHPVLALCYN
jgi:hypothetical protein